MTHSPRYGIGDQVYIEKIDEFGTIVGWARNGVWPWIIYDVRTEDDVLLCPEPSLLPADPQKRPRIRLVAIDGRRL